MEGLIRGRKRPALGYRSPVCWFGQSVDGQREVRRLMEAPSPVNLERMCRDSAQEVMPSGSDGIPGPRGCTGGGAQRARHLMEVGKAVGDSGRTFSVSCCCVQSSS